MNKETSAYVLPFEIADRSTEQLLTWPAAKGYCDKVGGGWRLPTVAELYTIYNTHSSDFRKRYYWTSNEGLVEKDYATYMCMATGCNYEQRKSAGLFVVRLVRDFVTNKEVLEELAKTKARIAELEKQLQTTIVPQASSESAFLSKIPFEIAPKILERKLNWYEANEYCSLLGQRWRLPTKQELDMIFKYDHDLLGDYYWTSETSDYYSVNQSLTGDHAWCQTMVGGRTAFDAYKADPLYVRPVRNILMGGCLQDMEVTQPVVWEPSGDGDIDGNGW